MHSFKEIFPTPPQPPLPLIGDLENTSSPPNAKFTRLECEIECKVELGIPQQKINLNCKRRVNSSALN